MPDGVFVFAFPVSLLGGWKGGLHQACSDGLGLLYKLADGLNSSSSGGKPGILNSCIIEKWKFWLACHVRLLLSQWPALLLIVGLALVHGF